METFLSLPLTHRKDKLQCLCLTRDNIFHVDEMASSPKDIKLFSIGEV
jgi:hypothetical protein